MMRPVSALACLLSIAALMACTRRVAIHSDAPHLGAGLYRARIATESGERFFHLELKPSGRFSLRTYAKDCLLSEEEGAWRSTGESLELDAKEKSQRALCSESLALMARDGLLAAPIRVTSSRSFQMIHEEINQGTEWTDWTMAANPGLPETMPEDPKAVVTSSLPITTPPNP